MLLFCFTNIIHDVLIFLIICYNPLQTYKELYYSDINQRIVDKIAKIFLMFYKYRLHKLGIKLGFTIPINVFREGLALFHWGTIVVNSYAKVGKSCKLYCCTNIADGVEINGNVFIAPGVKLQLALEAVELQ